jgi:hypothetical protein
MDSSEVEGVGSNRVMRGEMDAVLFTSSWERSMCFSAQPQAMIMSIVRTGPFMIRYRSKRRQIRTAPSVSASSPSWMDSASIRIPRAAECLQIVPRDSLSECLCRNGSTYCRSIAPNEIAVSGLAGQTKSRLDEKGTDPASPYRES